MPSASVQNLFATISLIYRFIHVATQERQCSQDKNMICCNYEIKISYNAIYIAYVLVSCVTNDPNDFPTITFHVPLYFTLLLQNCTLNISHPFWVSNSCLTSWARFLWYFDCSPFSWVLSAFVASSMVKLWSAWNKSLYK